MRLGLVILTITNSLLLSACAGTKTEFQFGNTVPPASSSTHNDLGNTQENTKMNVLAPTAAIEPQNVTLEPLPQEPVKVVQPKRIKPNPTVATLNVAPEATEPAAATLPTTLAPAAPVISNWQPNEALLIRSNELIYGLQKELGKKPSTGEMQKRLQSHMGLSAMQAQQVIAALGM